MCNRIRSRAYQDVIARPFNLAMQNETNERITINYLHNNSEYRPFPTSNILHAYSFFHAHSPTTLYYISPLFFPLLCVYFVFFYLKCYIEISSFWVPHNFVSLATTMARTTWPSSQNDKNCALLLEKIFSRKIKWCENSVITRSCIPHISFPEYT